MAITAIEKVLTLDYWKYASKLQVGDYVFNREGKPVKIKLIQQYFSEDCYRVKLDDHLTVSGDKHLAFRLENRKYRNRIHQYKMVHKRFKRPLKHMTVLDIQETGLRNNFGWHEFSIPSTKPLDLPHQDLPVPPFVFGFWIMNKTMKGMRFPTGYEESITEKFKDHGYKVIKQSKNNFMVVPSIESQLAPFIPTKIPANYMLASVEQRTELLSGILHSKSRLYSVKTDTFSVSSKAYRAIAQIQQLVESLGCKTISELKDSIGQHYLRFKYRYSKLVPQQESSKVKVTHARRYIRAIEPIQSQMCVHIETEGDDNTILVGEGFISVC